MGLENLKSVFSEIITPFSQTDGKQVDALGRSNSTPSNTTIGDRTSFIPPLGPYLPTTLNFDTVPSAEATIDSTKYQLKLLNQSPVGAMLANLNPAALYYGGDGVFQGAPKYFDGGDITTGFQFATNNGTALYEKFNYDPRTPKPRAPIFNVNVYTGTTFDNNLGGLFNSPTDKYSNVFRTINKPSFDNIVTSGNIAQYGNPAISGVGYPDVLSRKMVFNMTNPPSGYYQNGSINLSAGSWYVGNSSAYNANPFVASNPDSNFGKRTIVVNGERLKGNQLGKGNLVFSTLYNHNHTSDRDDRLNIRYGSGWWRAGLFFMKEPYVVRKIPKKGGFWSSLGKWPGRALPQVRWTSDLVRITKFNLSPYGVLQNASHLFRQQENMRSHTGLNGGLLLPKFRTGMIPGNVSVHPYRGKTDLISDLIGGQKDKTEYTDSLEEVGGFNLVSMGNIYQVKYGNQFGQTNKLYVSGKPYSLLNYSLETGITAPLYKEKHPRAKPSNLGEFGGMGMLMNTYNPRTLGFNQAKSYKIAKPDIPGGIPTWRKGKISPKEIDYTEEVDFHKRKKPVALRDYPFVPYKTPGDSLKDLPSKGAYWSLSHGNSGNAVFKTVWDSMNSQITWNDGNTKRVRGDFMTLQPISTEKSDRVEKASDGMPFYFKDLRDGRYIILRGYIEGITETVNSNWASADYIGRSDKVYTYTGAERDVSFTLKLFANSADERDMIYGKLEKLHQLCYPQYVHEPHLDQARMRPPLMNFRLGELYGNKGSDAVGFFKSLNFSFPDQTPWETKNGKRVPKFATVAMSITILHDGPPNMATQFYGITTALEDEGIAQRLDAGDIFNVGGNKGIQPLTFGLDKSNVEKEQRSESPETI